jgi:phosphoribosylglycinamide formyltransferase 2
LVEIVQERAGASAVVLAEAHSEHPTYSGLEDISALSKTDFRIFGKPSSRPYRRMGVALTYDTLDTPITEVVDRAKEAARLLTVHS